jgi:hypothetical protein
MLLSLLKNEHRNISTQYIQSCGESFDNTFYNRASFLRCI